MQNLILHALQVAAVVQLIIAVLNLFLVRLMNWRADLAAMPLLIREVFQVHKWFISITLGIFGILTLRFAAQMTNDPAARWLAAAIGIFWSIRVILQITYYSANHWRGIASRTLIHIALLLVYGALAAIYLLVGFQNWHF